MSRESNKSDEEQQEAGSPTVVFAAHFGLPYKKNRRSGEMTSVRYAGRNRRFPAFDRRSTDVIREIFGKRQWDVRIEVGILDVNETHYALNPKWNTTYDILLDKLFERGYDPLLPLRSKKFVEKVNRVLALKIIEANKRIDKGSHHSIKEQVSSYGREIRDYCRDYIRGGIAPGKDPLASHTIEIRESKEENNPEFYTYRYGINEPLWETGQLEQAIDFRVFVHEGFRQRLSQGEAKAVAEFSEKMSEGLKRAKKERMRKLGADSQYASPSGESKSWAGAKSRGNIGGKVVAEIISRNSRAEIERQEIAEEQRLEELRRRTDYMDDVFSEGISPWD